MQWRVHTCEPVGLMHPPASHGAPRFAQRSMNPEMGRRLWAACTGDEREGEERGKMRGMTRKNCTRRAGPKRPRVGAPSEGRHLESRPSPFKNAKVNYMVKPATIRRFDPCYIAGIVGIKSTRHHCWV
ncbi:hypothetical protein FA95DRAFT_867947 [Auriscalpium vulgare]|uniref:Uncharacterized protein n=1 Tax=Auriscalpium vulgare TaxID=40419 RepID=A0ACB8R8N2_9AGAM|nr:hypothetical protein FA95DRAFT_867947 [Auriscalpium vulgare]